MLLKSPSVFLLLILLAVSAVAADDSTIMLPLGLVHLNGAYGSVWETELVIKNAGQQEVQIGNAGDLCSITCPFVPIRISPNEAVILSDSFNSSLLASAAGLILHLQTRQVAPPADVRFNFRVRDLSRQESTWGTELPVVHASEFTAEPLHLLNLPTSAIFRFTIRAYALDGESPIAAKATIYELSSGRVLREVPFTLQRFGNSPNLPNSPNFYPAYAQLDSLASDLSNIGIERIGIEVAAVEPTQKLWAFATVTNNESQHVTTVTPR